MHGSSTERIITMPDRPLPVEDRTTIYKIVGEPREVDDVFVVDAINMEGRASALVIRRHEVKDLPALSTGRRLQLIATKSGTEWRAIR